MQSSRWLVPCWLAFSACSETPEGAEPNTGGNGTMAGVGGATSGAGGAGGAGANGGGNGGSGGDGAAGASGTAGAGTGGGAGAGGAAGAAMGGSAGGDAAAAGASTSGASGAAGAAAGNGGSAGNAAGGASGAGGKGGSGSGCDPTAARENRDLVGKALDELFVEKDLSAIDRYWSDPYLQHNPIATSGVATFRSLMSSFVTSPSFSYQRLRTLAECDLVIVQGRYSSTGVIFDMFRVQNARIMEHWDSDTNQASDSAGTMNVVDGAATAENRAHVLEFLDVVLFDGETARASEFIAAGHVEHRGNGTGPTGFTAFVTSENLEYSTVHHVIADGNFVFTLSEGTRDGSPFGFYDLFRLDGGSIVEHWDSRRAVPNSTASGLPIF